MREYRARSDKLIESGWEVAGSWLYRWNKAGSYLEDKVQLRMIEAG
ncbi:MAG TPA: hypothetical protein P5172_07560 [Syntrophales bacterium]|nr:hypothetical protein [Syntrophales bacterium]